MFDDEVVVLHALDITCDASVNMVWFLVVFQVFVVRKYGGYMW